MDVNQTIDHRPFVIKYPLLNVIDTGKVGDSLPQTSENFTLQKQSAESISVSDLGKSPLSIVLKKYFPIPFSAN